MSKKFDRRQLRKLIQQEISSLGEDLLVAPKSSDKKQGTPPLSPGSDKLGKGSCNACGEQPDSCLCPDKHFHEEGESCHECGAMMYECACQGEDSVRVDDYSLDTMSTNDAQHLEIPDVANHHGGAYMSKSQLHKIEKYSQKLYNLIPKGFDLEDWMRTKISQIADDISEVYHALDHDNFEGDI